MTIDEGVFINELKKQQAKLSDESYVKNEIEDIKRQIVLKKNDF